MSFPDDVCIHHLFEKQALKHPDKVAVILEDKRLTYGELNQKANQLAHHLQKLGVNQATPAGPSWTFFSIWKSVKAVLKGGLSTIQTSLVP
ncbi:MAG: AMP-binding protein [Thermodesulfobacteriota bacterium]|nr:AMP-binding protein [Thermodesulfobacteriota bacterium]